MAEFQGGKIPPQITEFGEGTPTTRVTEGHYLLELTSINGGSRRDDGEGFQTFRLRIVDGPIGLAPEGIGLPIWRTTSPFDPERVWATGQTYGALGCSAEEITALVGYEFPAGQQGLKLFQEFCSALGSQLKGRRFGATLTDYTGGKIPVSQVSRVFSTTEYEAMKAAAGASPAAPQPSSASNGAASQVPDEEVQSRLASLLGGSKKDEAV